MALLYMDSFDGYAWANQTRYPYIGSYGTESLVTGRTGNAYRITNPVNRNVQSVGLVIAPWRPANTASGIIGFAVRSSSWSLLDDTSASLISVWLGSLCQVYLRMNNDGTLSAHNGNSDALYGYTSAALQDDTWVYVEFKWVIHASSGSLVIRFNNQQVYSFTGDTLPDPVGYTAEWTSVRVRGAGWAASGSATMDVDDLYLLDLTGSYNTDFWGDTTVAALHPNAAGNSAQWSRGGSDSGTNYGQVNETDPNGDTNYIYTTTAGNVDLYNFPSTVTGAVINGVQVVAVAKKGDTGVASIAAQARESSSDYTHGAPLGIASNTVYGTFVFPYDRMPAGGAWSESGFNAVEWGIKKTS